METKVCKNCQGIKGEANLTGYMIHNAYDETQDRWMVCEQCNGTGIHNPDLQELSLSDLSFMLMDEVGNA